MIKRQCPEAAHVAGYRTWQEEFDRYVCWLAVVETGIRMGAARALDVDDYRPGADTPHLRIRHRPENDTPIKNGSPGERTVGIS